jgi:hypothetical protein
MLHLAGPTAHGRLLKLHNADISPIPFCRFSTYASETVDFCGRYTEAVEQII